MVEDNRTYSSKLSREDISSLWEQFKGLYPALYNDFLHPDYTSKNYEEKIRSRDGGLHSFIQKRYWNSMEYIDMQEVYSDMIIFLDRNIRKIS